MYVLPHKKYIMQTKQSAMLLLQICHVVGRPVRGLSTQDITSSFLLNCFFLRLAVTYSGCARRQACLQLFNKLGDHYVKWITKALQALLLLTKLLIPLNNQKIMPTLLSPVVELLFSEKRLISTTHLPGLPD